MNKTILRLIFLFLGLFIGKMAHGTHIIGGRLSYEFVSRAGTTNTYNLKMRLYRDCSKPTNSAFNSSIVVYIYQGNTANVPFLRVNLLLRRSSIQAVPPPSYPCLTPPSYVCVQQADYFIDTIQQISHANLPISTETYRAVGRICCRNDLIGNIISPRSAGASYYFEITPEGQLENNSSAEFTRLPPTVICQNEALNYDHAAADRNGDDLLYEFCPSPNNGTLGTSCTGNSGFNPCNAPFANVQYATDFSGTNPFGNHALPAVRINSRTGAITGTPLLQGNYVVGVCVKEYKNGILMGMSFRDFQFNVEPCKRDIIAQLDADSVGPKSYVIRTCDTFTVNFRNLSSDRRFVNNILWRFDVNGTTRESTDWDASITFPDTGTYRGVLYLNPNTVCGDSAFVTVKIGAVAVRPTARIRYDTCIYGPVLFQMTANLTSDIVRYTWNYNDGSPLDSNRLSTSHQYRTAGNHGVTLRFYDRFGCAADTTIRFDWQPSPPFVVIEPSNYVGCAPAEVRFLNRSIPVDSTYRVTWRFGDGSPPVSSLHAQHTYATAGVYSINLSITSPLGCVKTASFPQWIRVNPKPRAGFDYSPKTPTNFDSRVSFRDTSSGAMGWQWFFQRPYGFSNDRNPAVSFNRDTGWVAVKQVVANEFGCLDSAFAKVYVKPEIRYFLPNAFTPNADATNDGFRGVGVFLGMKDFEMKIFDRWGEMIFETNDPRNSWNGQKHNIGDHLPQAVYAYWVRYITPQNETVILKGYVTLLR